MAIRNTTYILKNSDIVNRPLPSILIKGEPIVNTAEGIMYFSGVTTSTSEWTPAGTGATANFFEVGSNLYDLRLRNKILSYNGLTNLSGKFLSGTTNGFVLSDISSIVGVDTYVTGFTYLNNVLTIKQNVGQADLTTLINTMTGLTVNGDLIVTGTTSLSGSTFLYAPITIGNPYSVVNVDTLTSYTQTNDVYVTGNTYTPATNSSNAVTYSLLYHGTPMGGAYSLSGQNTFTTGGTYNNTNKEITFKNNDGATGYTVDLSSIDVNDTYVTGGTVTTAPSNNSVNGTIGLLYNQDVAPSTYSLPFTDVFTTGFTYNETNNTFTLKDNSGNTFNQSFNTVSGLTLSNLTAGRVVYVGSGGTLTDEAGFTYDASTNVFSVPSDGTVNVGTGGLNVDGDAVIQGSLRVFGPAISAFTSELYVEDSNITLNYNPTGNTTVTSIGAGISIQDGNGITNGNVNFNINRLDSLTGLTINNIPDVSEYVASTGYDNRGWITQLNDIVIRSTNVNTPNGVRVLTEFDVLDGGFY